MTDHLKTARDALDGAHYSLGDSPYGEMNTAVGHMVTAVAAVLAHLRTSPAAPPESPPTLPLRADEWELKWTAGSAPDGWERSGAWLVAVSGDSCPCLWARRRKAAP